MAAFPGRPAFAGAGKRSRPADRTVTPVMARSPVPLTPGNPGPDDPPAGPDRGARGEEAVMRGLGIACAIGLGLVPLASDDTAAGLSADLFGPLAVELQARQDALTGDLDARGLKRKAALEKALQAIADGTDGIEAVPGTALAVDRILRKAYREEFKAPGSGSSPLPGLSADIAEALYAELDRVHWTVVSRLYPHATRQLFQKLVKDTFGKARPALIAARHSLDSGNIPGALRKLAVAGPAIGEWAYYADFPAGTATTAFLGKTLQQSMGGVACGTDPLGIDFSLGEFDPVASTFTSVGSVHIRAASVTGPGTYPLGPGDAWWTYEGRPEVWDALPGGWLRVLEGTPETTPFVGVFEFDATDRKKVLKIRYGCFSASCSPP
jgi:hypothetical protein